MLQGLTAAPDDARQIVSRTGADYLVLCRGENEVEKYRRLYPRSLIAASGDIVVGEDKGALADAVRRAIKRLATPTMASTEAVTMLWLVPAPKVEPATPSSATSPSWR